MISKKFGINTDSTTNECLRTYVYCIGPWILLVLFPLLRKGLLVFDSIYLTLNLSIYLFYPFYVFFI